MLIPGDRQNAGASARSRFRQYQSACAFQRDPRMVDSRRRAGEERAQLAERFDIRPRDPSLPFAALSGGNQQKVLLAKWLQLRPRLILLDEPTQGVDVGAREQVFDAIRSATRMDACVLCASSDYEQLAAICDRVLVFNRGRVVTELYRREHQQVEYRSSLLPGSRDDFVETVH